MSQHAVKLDSRYSARPGGMPRTMLQIRHASTRDGFRLLLIRISIMNNDGTSGAHAAFIDTRVLLDARGEHRANDAVLLAQRLLFRCNSRAVSLCTHGTLMLAGCSYWLGPRSVAALLWNGSDSVKEPVAPGRCGARTSLSTARMRQGNEGDAGQPSLEGFPEDAWLWSVNGCLKARKHALIMLSPSCWEPVLNCSPL